ncbi:MAG TPA: stage II sporulation protein M [Lysobacter sp.]|nr:stage II sporulation protein M [Lysobacter sp.]
MKQAQFVARHEAEWAALEAWLEARAGTVRPRRTPAQPLAGGLADHEVPARYRRICQQLAIARRRGYSPVVTERLQRLMQRGHAVLYRTPPTRWRRVARFLIAGFPRLVRTEATCVAAAAALFALPLLAAFVAIQLRPELSGALFDPVQLAEFERMYDPADPQRRLGRDSSTNLAMFGHYVWNNVSIGFRCFASGLLAMVGSVVVLLFNGVTIGGIAGHLQAVGHGDPFWRFVAGHSAPELTAIVISGAAGLRLGLALVAPGRRRRLDALVDAGRVGARLCAGVLAMLVFAAFVEAFWSSIGWIPAAVKYAVGGALWALVLGWLWRGGRGLTDAELDAEAA